MLILFDVVPILYNMNILKQNLKRISKITGGE